MKKTALLTAAIAAGITIFTACSKSKDTTGGGGSGGITFSCNGITPSFTADVQPILNTVCSINSNCHASGSTNTGGPLTTYAEVNAKKASIRAQILAGIMPQSGTITQPQINAFICWIDSGAPNN
ncbi:hypothetical protein [Ferruginibacter sp.]